ncbi:PREDICTED: exosome component 10 [Habropoda laboriosa]|uniref:exosome component 10 n=1 Tax=Habropoda laboriosa TaxID=597456 RepID=UPI00083DBE99|nr:PREDICTED: exosome component 10 [Habropoda laboriosa]
MDPTEDWSGNCQVLENQTQESQTEQVNQVVPGYTNFADYVQEAFDVIRLGIKAANNLPTGSNFNYYSCFPSFLRAKDENIQMLLNVMQNVLGTANVTNKISNRDEEEIFDLLLEANDGLLDRANALMDVESGVTKPSEVELVVTHAKKQLINGSWNNQVHKPSQNTDAVQSVRLLAGKNIQRPQLTFKDKIDNSGKPWCPRIKDKPNSLKPLAIYLEEEEHGEVFSHPYEYELDLFVVPNSQLNKSKPVNYKSLEDTPLVLVKDPADIKLLLEDLKRYKEIAVDLEHHSYRSFQGITCLMQISTGDTDYLIDTLSLRSELHELNEIFTKPTILKVFHGADLDIQWLQRDLSVYVVNMFDTHQAAKQMNLPYLSLAYLLKQYCNVDPDKHFQMADWRIRPLPEKLQKYAREDTHYLLYIKDILKNALIDAANGQVNILKAVYDRSTEICKKTYVKPVWTEESCMNMYRKSKKMFNNKQLYAFKELHKWRDCVARNEDDSVAYVLPKHMLLNIAETLPREMQGILACCDSIPPLVRQNLLKLHKIILKAREQPLIKPVLEDLRQRLTQRSYVTNSEVWMYSPHDIPSGMEARADLPCLLDENNAMETFVSNTTVHAVKHTVTVFDSPNTSEDEDMEKDEGKGDRKKKFVFVSPFERYKRVIPMVAEEETQERERQKQEEDKEKEKKERLNKGENVEQKDITESRNRVLQHFKKVTEIVTEKGASTSSRKPSKVPLSQMQGRKRKQNSDINEQNKAKKGKVEDNLLTPVPSLEGRMTQGVRQGRDEMERLQEENVREKNTARSQEQASNKGSINSMRPRQKGDRKRIIKELNSKGMMPSKVFDYKGVDFNSFQGGSKNTRNQVNFEQKMKKKKKDKPRKRNKKKVNI